MCQASYVGQKVVAAPAKMHKSSDAFGPHIRHSRAVKRCQVRTCKEKYMLSKFTCMFLSYIALVMYYFSATFSNVMLFCNLSTFGPYHFFSKRSEGTLAVSTVASCAGDMTAPSRLLGFSTGAYLFDDIGCSDVVYFSFN